MAWGVAAAVFTAAPAAGHSAQPGDAPEPRGIEQACPPDQTPQAGFDDVAGSVHEPGIDCVAWWAVTRGVTDRAYAPSVAVTRDQMASFLARLLRRVDADLPADPPDAFADDDGGVHEGAIDQLAAAGVTEGTTEGRYGPRGSISRAQMASFLDRVYAHRSGVALAPGEDAFGDDDDSVHEGAIDRVAAAGLTVGKADGTYDPSGPVTRAQTATFLARLLSLLVDEDHVVPPDDEDHAALPDDEGGLDCTATLEPGGRVTCGDEVALAAPAGVLDDDVEVSIRRVDDPREEVPFPPELSHVEVVGDFYAVSASRDVDLPADGPLALGLSASGRASPDDLGMVRLNPPLLLGHQPLQSDAELWTTSIQTVYDEDTDLVGSLTGYLGPERMVYALADGGGPDPTATTDATAQAAATGPEDDTFAVACSNFDHPEAGECTTAHEDATRQALDEAYGAWVEGLGYNEPRLTRELVAIEWADSTIYELGGYLYYLEYRKEKDAPGTYWSSGKAVTRYSGAPAEPSSRVTRHEFFHALQYGFSEFYKNGANRDGAVVEGMAELAEVDVHGPDSAWKRRPVDVALFRGNRGGDVDGHDYDARDFWLYLAERFGMGYEYLVPMLQRGGSPQDVDDALRNAPYPPWKEHVGAPDTPPSLGRAYWGWAKDQAFEAQRVGTSRDPCGLSAAVDDLGQLDVPSSRARITRDGPAPFTSAVLEVSLPAKAETYLKTVDVVSGDPLVFKLYEPDEQGRQTCLSTDRDGSPHTLGVPETTTKIHLLVANPSNAQNTEYELVFSPDDHDLDPIARDDDDTFWGAREGGSTTLDVLSNDHNPINEKITVPFDYPFRVVDVGPSACGSPQTDAASEVVECTLDDLSACHTEEVELFEGDHVTVRSDRFDYTARSYQIWGSGTGQRFVGDDDVATVDLTMTDRLNTQWLLPDTRMFNLLVHPGELLVGVHLDELGQYRSQLMHGDGSSTSLGGFAVEEGSTVATGLNSQDQVVGWSHNEAGDTRAFVWDSAQGLREPGPSLGDHSRALAVGDEGQIAGHTTLRDDGETSHATLWLGGEPVLLSKLVGGDSLATAVNDHNQAVGVASVPDDVDPFAPWMPCGCGSERAELTPQLLAAGVSAFSYDHRSGEATTLETLGGDATVPRDVNDLGQVVGASTLRPGDPTAHAFLWEDGAITDLGTLGGDSSEALAVSTQGTVVGVSELADGTRRAFLWHEGLGMVDLNELSATDSELEIVAATGVTDNGKVTAHAVDAEGELHAVALELGR